MTKKLQQAGFKQTTEVGVLSKSQAEALMDISDKAEMANAMMGSAMQMMLGIESILIQDHNFSTEDLEHFEMKLKRMMTTMVGLKQKELTVLNYQDMEVVGRLAEKWLIEEKKNNKDKLLVDTVKKELEKGK